MAKFERYEPRGDSGRVFDGAEVESEDEEGSRLPLLLVIGLVVVAAFAGVVWLAYTQGVQRGRADAPRMLVAANGPVKVAPANSGGSETPFTKLKIYQQPAPPQDEDVESTSQPPTPKPAAAPLKLAETDQEPAAPVAKTAPPKPAAPARIAQATPPPATAPAVATRPPRSLNPAVARPAPVVPESKPLAPPKPVATAQPAAAAAPPAETHSGAVALQIGAYKSQDEADSAWKTFTHKHPMASAYQEDVRKVDLGDKGVWYRLRLGGFGDKSAASAFCDKLKADGGTCFLAH